MELAGTLKLSFNHKVEDELLSSGKKITLFRIVQEQLKNIIKYSKATTTEISLHSTEDNVVLVMKDDGKGFDPKQTRQGIGLSNIHERARIYNGTAEIKSSSGAGCTLTAAIPVKEN